MDVRQRAGYLRLSRQDRRRVGRPGAWSFVVVVVLIMCVDSIDLTGTSRYAASALVDWSTREEIRRTHFGREQLLSGHEGADTGGQRK